MTALAVPIGRSARTWLVAATALLLTLTLLSPPPAAAVEGPTRGGLDGADLQPADVGASQSLPRTEVGDLGRGDEPRTYLIRLRDPAVPTYRGGVAGLEATSPDGAERLEADSQPARQYREHLEETQVAFVARMDRTAGRDVEVPFTYQFAVNGMAAVLTPEEARAVASDPEVIDIRLDEERELHTDAGPEWIDADEVWAEGGLPEGSEPCVGSCGEGIVIGTIDTGISPANPSFADIGDDGYDHTNPRGRYYGVCDPAHEQHDPNFPCNDKLIGAYGFVDGFGAVDYDGHGSHTASTSGGNVVKDVVVTTQSGFTTPPFDIAGVAPHANIIAYLGCCSLSGLTASIDQAIEDEVDVINYSIGSSAPSSLWDEFDTIGFLNARAAGIVVATSNGNDGPLEATTGSPSDAPWIISVGASSHNRYNLNVLTDLTSSAGNLADIEGKAVTGSLPSTPIVYAGDFGDPLCLEDSGNEDAFSGKIVICDRGINGRVAKSENVAAQGAAGFVLVNDEANDSALTGDEFAVPGVFISYADGQVLLDWLDNGADDHSAAVAGTDFIIDDARADVLIAFSSRGPNRAVDVIAPDVTAPGVDILAALGAGGAEDPINYDVQQHGFISGTSMASPHVAGAAALIVQERPGWTPAEVQSALMTTAVPTVEDFDGDLATPYEQGAGRVDVDAAVAAGLLFDETFEDYMAANPAEGGDPKTLNLPSFANTQCLSSCSWQRTATVPATVSGDVTWIATTVSDDGLDLDVQLTDATVSPGDTMTISVNADVSTGTEGDTHFGRITLTPSDSSIPTVTMPVAVVPSSGVLPGAVDITTRRDTGSQLVEGLEAIEITDFTASVSGLAKANLTAMELAQDPTDGDPYDEGGTAFITVEVGADARTLVAEITESEAPDLDLFVGTGDTPSLATQVCTSTSPSAAERCDIPDPAAGTWWVLVQNWEASADQPDALTLATAVVPQADLGNASVEGPETNPVGEPFDIRFFWDLEDAEAGDRFYGTIDLGSSPGTPGDIGSIPVTLQRVADDVTKVADVDEAEAGDTVTYTLEVAPNVTPEDLTYAITDTIPDGMTYVPGSLTGADATFDDGVITWTPIMPTPVGATGDYVASSPATSQQCLDWSGFLDLAELGVGFAGLDGDTTFGTAFDAIGPFEHYGQSFPNLVVAEDGLVTVTGGYGGAPWEPQNLPNPAAPNGVFAPLWSDLELSVADGRGMRLASSSANGVAVIQWDDPFEFTVDNTVGPSVGKFQTWIYNSVEDFRPEVTFEYDTLGALPDTATIGIEDILGQHATSLLDAGDPSSVLTEGGTICLDYEGPSFDPAVITYQATVDDGVVDTNLTNIVEHITDNPGDETAITAATVTVGTPALPTVTVEATQPVATPGQNAEFTFTRTDPAFALTVDYETSGSAVAGTDYAELPGSVTFGPGELTATVSVRLLDPPGPSDLTLTLLDGAGYVVGEPSSASVTLSPDTGGGGGGGGGTPGAVPQVSVTADDDSFTFTRTGGVTNEMTIAYDVGGTAEPGEDYTELSGLVTFAAGSATATVDVDVLAGATEGATIEVAVVDGDAYDVGSPSSATITIEDSQTPPAGEDEVEVLAGATRIQTAIAISQDAFPENGSADAVILARADVPFDALAATPLAPEKNGPLLLTDVADLHADTAAEIDRVMADGGTVYVLGGTAALSADVEAALTSAGHDVQRIAGPTRYETALAVAEEIGEPDAILIASGEQFPDALSAGAAAAATGGLVLLTPEDAPHDAVTDYVADRPGTPVYAIGGPAAAVFSDATPIVGSGREATSVLVAEEFFDDPTMVGLARGDEFADALTGGAHAALHGGPVTLTPSTLLHPEVEAYLCANSGTLSNGFVYGGEAAIQSGVVDAFAARLAGEGCAA